MTVSCKKRSLEKDDYPAESMYAKALPENTHSCCGGPSSVDVRRRHDLDRLPVTYVWMTAQKTAGSQKKKKKENYTSSSTRKLSFAHGRILISFLQITFLKHRHHLTKLEDRLSTSCPKQKAQLKIVHAINCGCLLVLRKTIAGQLPSLGLSIV